MMEIDGCNLLSFDMIFTLRFCALAEMMGIQMLMRWHPDARHTHAYAQNIDLNKS